MLACQLIILLKFIIIPLMSCWNTGIPRQWNNRIAPIPAPVPQVQAQSPVQQAQQDAL